VSDCHKRKEYASSHSKSCAVKLISHYFTAEKW